MHFSINVPYTRIAQLKCSNVDSVYTDNENEYIIEKHKITTHDAFKYRLAIKRTDRAPIRSWRVIQNIKNSVAGVDAVAVEIYPRESDVTDTANIYHLWVFRDGLSPNVSLVKPH